MHVNGHVPGYIDAIVACFPRDVLPKVVEVDQVEPPAFEIIFIDISENIIKMAHTILTLSHLAHHLIGLRPSGKILEKSCMEANDDRIHTG